MALSRAAGVCRLALRTQWAVVRLLGSAASGGELPGDDKKRGRLVDLGALRRERALRPPAERRQPAPPRNARSNRPTAEQLRLNAELLACSSAEAVLGLVSSRLAVFNEVNAATALLIISRRVGKGETARWFSSDARFAQLLSAAESLFARMAPQQLSNALYACGQLGNTPPTDWLQRYWHSSALKLSDFIPQHFSNTLYACGQLGITPPADWLQRYWHASAPKLGELNEQNFSNTLYACGQLGITPPADWLQRYWHMSALKLGEFKPQALSNTLYACGQLGITPPADWLQRYWHASASTLGDFIPQHFSNTLYACGQLGITPPADWLQRYWHASASKLSEFIPQHFSNTLYACGQLGITPPADWLQRYWDASTLKLSEFIPQNYSNTLYACGQLGITPPAEWLQHYWHASASKLGEFSEQNLSNTLYACGQLGITPPADWLQCYWHVSASKLGEFIPQDLSNTLYAFGQLGITPSADWLQRFSDSFERSLPDADNQNLANTALALATLGVWELPLWRGLWERLCQALPLNANDWSAVDQLNAQQLYQAYKAAAMERPGLLPTPDPELLVAARKSWTDGLATDVSKSSRLHADISACLTRMGVTHANERWCERAERSIDIAIDGAAPVALEVDGPTHFLQDGKPTGSTLLRNRMLAAHGWRVAVVDYREWNALQTEAQREEFLRRQLA